MELSLRARVRAGDPVSRFPGELGQAAGDEASTGKYDAVMAGPARTSRGAVTVTAAALVSAALLAAALLAAGCGSPPGQVARHRAPPGTAGATTAALATGAQRRGLAARYLRIAEEGNRRLEAELDPLTGRDRTDLAAVRRDLRAAAATEWTFNRQLLGIAFRPATERFARFLYWVNQARASLTAQAACVPSLRRLQAYERGLLRANRPVEQAVAIIRGQLGLPPPGNG